MAGKRKSEVIKNGPVKWALKILIERDREAGVMKISQGQFTREVLQRFGFDGGYSDVTPTYDQGPNSVMSEEDTPQDSEEIAKLHAQYPYYEALECLWWRSKFRGHYVHGNTYKIYNGGIILPNTCRLYNNTIVSRSDTKFYDRIH